MAPRTVGVLFLQGLHQNFKEYKSNIISEQVFGKLVDVSFVPSIDKSAKSPNVSLSQQLINLEIMTATGVERD